MAPEPTTKRAVAFFDGQNLYHAAREAFGYSYPNFDPVAPTRIVCAGQGWEPGQVRFYTGIPRSEDDPVWNGFWARKLRAMSWRQVDVVSRPLHYRDQRVRLPDGTEHRVRLGEEKGIDVRIAIDAIRLAHRDEYDVAILFSQDQDLSEVAREIRVIAHEQGGWIKAASAFPSSRASVNRRGIERTDWIRIDRASYDACIDPRDYRPKSGRGGVLD